MLHEENSFSESMRAKKEEAATKALLEDDDGDFDLELKTILSASTVNHEAGKSGSGTDFKKRENFNNLKPSLKSGDDHLKGKRAHPVSSFKRTIKYEIQEQLQNGQQVTDSVEDLHPKSANGMRYYPKWEKPEPKGIRSKISLSISKTPSSNTSQSINSSGAVRFKYKGDKTHLLVLPEQVNLNLELNDGLLSRGISRVAPNPFRNATHIPIQEAENYRRAPELFKSQNFYYVSLRQKHSRSSSNPSITESQKNIPVNTSPPQIPLKLEFHEGKRGVVVTNLDDGDDSRIREMDKKILNFLSPKEKSYYNVASTSSKSPNKLVLEDNFGLVNIKNNNYAKIMRNTKLIKNNLVKKNNIQSVKHEVSIKEQNLNIYLNGFNSVRSDYTISRDLEKKIQPNLFSVSRPFKVQNFLKQDKLVTHKI